MRSTLNITTLMILLFSWTNCILADERESQELADLLDLLEEETAIATQNKMNADYVPGMVTVLHAEKLKAYGVQSVAEALDQVAGFYMTVNNSGNIVAVVRGVGSSLNASNLKFLMNGVVVNRPIDASADWILRMPISLVDRIEIIRGPGSALYGEFAFSGVVNIITRKENQIIIGGGSHSRKEVDLLVNHQFDSGASLSINTSLWDRENSGQKTGLDNFAGGGRGYSPGFVYDHEQGQILEANAAHHGYNLMLQLANVERGGWYGRNEAMPFDLEPREESIVNFRLEKLWELSSTLSLKLGVGALNTELKHATYLPIPKGVDPPGPPPPVLVDRYRRDGNQDSTERANMSLHWAASNQHSIFIDTGYVHSKVDSSFVYSYEIGSPRNYGAPDRTLVLAGSDRSLISTTLQDQWQISDTFEVTLGARYDDYSDWGSNTSPRIATVWRASDKHIFKFQYAEAFRPPTMSEQYPGPNTFPNTIFTDLNEEQLASSEFSYIYRDTGFSFRSTFFNTQVNDLIEFYLNPGDPPIWRNRGDISTLGVELEWQHKINRQLQWFANASFLDASDNLDEDKNLTGSVERLANLGFNWQVTDDVKHSVHYRYVGEQEGWDIQTRIAQTERFDAYHLINYSLTLKNLFAMSQLTVEMGINNLTDRAFNTIASPSQYPMGLPNGERTVWLRFNYAFE